MTNAGLATFHPQDRERIALVIDAVTTECAESHPFVEFHSGWVLLVDIDILHILLIERLLNQHSPYALPEIVRMEKQHLYLAFLHAHKTDGASGILHPHKVSICRKASSACGIKRRISPSVKK